MDIMNDNFNFKKGTNLAKFQHTTYLGAQPRWSWGLPFSSKGKRCPFSALRSANNHH